MEPLTNSYVDDFGGWGATAIDAFSTALVMGNEEVVNIILNYIPTINFTTSPYEISLFETNIRYVGGLLAGYDLLTGPLSYLATNKRDVEAILQQAKTLADTLSYAFDTPTGIPYNNLYLDTRTNDGSTTNGLATIGTLVLEWTHLSDLTGDPKYAELTQKAESYLLNPRPAFAQPFPGLLGTDVDIDNGSFIDADGGWVGGDDSFYEYLIKMYVYDSSRFSFYKDRWTTAVDSTIQYLTSHPSSRPDLTFVAEFNGRELIYESEHLACFDGGNIILGGLVLNDQRYIDYGLQLVAGCEDTYSSTLTGIGPESFAWSENGTVGVPADQLAFYEKAGYYILDGNYILRPEVLESFYYAYRATGDQKYRDWSWNGFQAINNTCRAGSGYAELINVNAPAGGGFNNLQDSFFLAEVLKYAYLIQAPDAEYQVNNNGQNQFVFNTEAHPLKVHGPPI